MTFPERFGPGETATEEEIDAWLKKMIKRGLLKKGWKVENGVGDWTYTNTWLSTYLVLPLHSLLTRLKLLGEGDVLPIVPDFRREKK